MKKRISLLLVCVLLCLSFAACGGDGEYTQYDGYTMISDPSIVEYYLYVPDYWVLDSATGMTSAYVSATDRSNVSVTTYEGTSYQEAAMTAAEAEGADWAAMDNAERIRRVLTAFWTAYETDFAKTCGSTLSYVKKADGGEYKAVDGLLGGRKSLAYEYDVTFLNLPYRVTQVLAAYGDRIYLFTFMGPTAVGEGEDYYSRHTAELADMLKIFAFQE